MRLVLLGLLSVLLNLLGNVLAAWADARWGLTQPSRIAVSLISFGIALVAILVLESGAPVPGSSAFHRFSYLFDLTRSRSLRVWATGFARLHAGRGPRYVAAAEVWAEGERRDLVALLVGALTARERSPGRRILVLGEPGCGKSTALERLALDLALYSVRWLGLRGPVPVLLRASDFQVGQDLREMIGEAFRLWGKPSTGRVLTSARVFDRLLGGRRLVLLCDGLDELGGERRDHLLGHLDALSRAAGLARVSVIATCRTRQDPGRALGLYETYSILELSDEAVLSFVEMHAPAGEAPEAAFERLSRGGFLEAGGLGRNPFWLRRLLEAGTLASTRSGILFETSRRALFGELEKPRSSTRAWRRPAEISEEQFVGECQHALGRLTGGLEGMRTLERDRARALLAAYLEERSRTVGIPPGLFPDPLLELARDAGLLHAQPDPVGFSHRLVQEFYTALDRMRRGMPEAADLARVVADPGQWTVLALYAGLLAPEERERLVRAVLTTGAPSALACAIAVLVENRSLGLSTLSDELVRALGEELGRPEEPDPQLRTSLRELLAIGHDPAAELMGRLLTSPSPRVRTRLCHLLALSEAPAALRLLVTLGLDDRDEGTGAAAVAALVGFGQRAVWPLIRQLADPLDESTGVRLRDRAAAALAELRAGEAVYWLLRCEGDDARMSACLARCTAERPGRLLVALAFGSPGERRRAALALPAVEGKRALRPLRAAVLDPDAGVRAAALKALAAWPADGETTEEGDLPGQPPAVQALVAALRVEEDEDFAEWALEEVGACGDEAAGEAALAAVHRWWPASKSAGRWALTRGRRRAGSSPDEPAVTRSLADRSFQQLLDGLEDLETRSGAVDEISRRAENLTTEELITLLQSNDWELSLLAGKALRQRRDPELRRALLDLQPGAGPNEESGILAALHGDDDPEVIEMLFAQLARGASEVFEMLADVAGPPEVERIASLVAEWLRPESRDWSTWRLAGQAIEHWGGVLPGGPEIGTFLLGALADPEFHDDARWVLAQVPLAWVHDQLADALHSAYDLAPELIHLVARCQHANALFRLAREVRQGEEREAAAAALGRLGSPRAFPVLRDLLQQEGLAADLGAAATASLVLLSPEIRPELAVLLFSRGASPSLLVASAEALSAPGEIPLVTVPRFFEMLADDSPRIAGAAAAALNRTADVLVPRVEAGSSRAAARSYFDLLLPLLEGEPTPRGRRLFGKSNELEDVLHMPLTGHLRESFWRTGLAGLHLILGGLAGWLCADRLLRGMAAFVYGAPVQEILLLLPPASMRGAVLVVFGACWLGVPAFLYQLWRFARPGLYSHEIRLIRPVLLLAGGGLLAMPFLAAGVSLLLRLAGARYAFLDLDGAARVVAIHRCTAALTVGLVWGAGLHRLRRFLVQRAREQYVLHLTEGKPIHRRQTPSATVGRALAFSGVICGLLAVALPLQVTAAVLVGLCWTLCLATALLWVFLLALAARPNEPRGSLGELRSAFLGTAGIPFEWGLWLVLFFLLWLSPHPGVWLGPMLGPAGQVVARAPGAGVWLAFTGAVWIGLLIFEASSWIGSLVLVRLIHLERSRKTWRERLGSLAGRAVLVSPVLVSRVAWSLLGIAAPAMDPAARSGWSIRLAILSALGIVAVGCLSSYRAVLGRVAPLEATVLLLVFALAGCVPSIVLAGQIGAGGYLMAILIPGLLAFLKAVGAGDLRSGIRRGLQDFRHASHELKTAVQGMLPGEPGVLKRGV